MKALEKIREIAAKLAAGGIEAADKEAEQLVTQGLDIELVDLYKNDPVLDDKKCLYIDEMAQRRSRREPLQYIVGYCKFLDVKILVGCGVLIPRPETELIAEMAVKRVRSYELRVKNQDSVVQAHNSNLAALTSIQKSQLRILDLCTGSGCLALALAREFPDAHVFGTDISEIALDYSKRNAELNRVNNVEFRRGHLFEPLCGRRDTTPGFDLIISNPPYIRTDEIQTLQPEIRDWEPARALDGGADGLNFYREIISQAGKFLKTNGILMLELGAGCADEAVEMMKAAGYADVELLKDYAGIERIIQGRWTN